MVQPAPMTGEFVSADIANSKRLSDQHLVATDALGGKLILPPVDISQGNLRILESGTADGSFLSLFVEVTLLPSNETLDMLLNQNRTLAAAPLSVNCAAIKNQHFRWH